MSRSPTRRVPPVGGDTPFDEFRRTEFARNLAAAMQAKGLSQSALARQMFPEEDEDEPRAGRGARRRGLVSNWLKGAVPDEKHWPRLEAVLSVRREALDPGLDQETVRREAPEVEIVAVRNRSGVLVTLLKVTKIVDYSTAAEVMRILSDAADPRGGGLDAPGEPGHRRAVSEGQGSAVHSRTARPDPV